MSTCSRVALLPALLLCACATPHPPGAALEQSRILPSKTIVFVHGMFVTPDCWKPWQDYFEHRGYHTLSPAWPEHDPPASAQRARHPNAALAKLTLGDLLAHYRKIIDGLSEKPILIGHSMGGLIVQVLLQEGRGVAGVAIDSAPPKGVIALSWSFFKANWPTINPFGSDDVPVPMQEADFRYGFVNTLSPEEQHAAWEAFAMPESRRVGNGPLTEDGRVDFERARPPLLMIAGEKDHMCPEVLNRKNFEAYKGPSKTDYKVFPGRDHFIIGSPGWREVADYIAGWIASNQ